MVVRVPHRGSVANTRHKRRVSRQSSTRFGVGTPTLPPAHPAVSQDDGWCRFAAEPFIVFHSVSGGGPLVLGGRMVGSTTY
jgi:hypothetical protein